jgi:hypothetical protein
MPDECPVAGRTPDGAREAARAFTSPDRDDAIVTRDAIAVDPLQPSWPTGGSNIVGPP